MEKSEYKEELLRLQPRNMDGYIFTWGLGYVQKGRVRFLSKRKLIRRIGIDFAFVENKDYSPEMIWKYLQGDVNKLRKDIYTQPDPTETFKNL